MKTIFNIVSFLGADFEKLLPFYLDHMHKGISCFSIFMFNILVLQIHSLYLVQTCSNRQDCDYICQRNAITTRIINISLAIFEIVTITLHAIRTFKLKKYHIIMVIILTVLGLVVFSMESWFFIHISISSRKVIPMYIKDENLSQGLNIVYLLLLVMEFIRVIDMTLFIRGGYLWDLVDCDLYLVGEAKTCDN
jgi:hypothetical protein